MSVKGMGGGEELLTGRVSSGNWGGRGGGGGGKEDLLTGQDVSVKGR